MQKEYYNIGYSCNEDPSNIKFQLHNHDEYEILLFLEGDARYVVEEKSYTLEPGDIILIRKHEMHRIYHNRPARYSRVILMVAPEFFVENDCREYETQFVKCFPGKIIRLQLNWCGPADCWMPLNVIEDIRRIMR